MQGVQFRRIHRVKLPKIILSVKASEKVVRNLKPNAMKWVKAVRRTNAGTNKQQNKVKNMKTLTKLALAAVMLAVALAAQARSKAGLDVSSDMGQTDGTGTVD